ncbi:MAG TPA: CehA/McbA family metallohydrolase [Pseudonocardiaceae bacterium]
MLTTTLTGTIRPGTPDWLYLPVEVPPGVNRIDVTYTYDGPGNACDIGIFGPDGHELGNARGFRGWSGGARTAFSLSASDATPGYLPGPITPGTWHVILGPYTVAPGGLHYAVTTTLTFGPPGPGCPPNPAPTSAPARERGRSEYRGDAHLHTVYSDGQRTPDELVADAGAAGLDFIVSTDHNTSSSTLRWGDHATDDLLICNGEEVTTRSGHWPAIGLPPGHWIDWRYRTPTDFRRFADEVHDLGGLVTAAHPFADCLGCGFGFPYDLVDLVEVWNGRWTADDQQTLDHWDGMLREGHWIPAIGNSDAHSHDQLVGLPHTVVLADSLSRDALMAGLRAGRSWLAESSTVDLTFTAGRTTGIGERLAVSGDTPVQIDVAVSGAPGTTVSILDQRGVRHAETVAAMLWTTCPRDSQWVRAEVRRPSGAMVARTNPIFLGVNGC